MTRSEARLRRRLQYQVRQIRRSEADRPHQLAQTRFILTLGLLFAMPIVIGGYLGIWLDNLCEGYSVGWTVTLLVTGVTLGFLNVFLYIKD